MNAPILLDAPRTWYGTPIMAIEGPVGGLVDLLPTFSRQTFANGQATNEFLDVISRDPFREDARSIPVATVSKKYALIQHTELVSQVVAALDGVNSRVSPYDAATTFLSKYGERLQCMIQFKGLSVEPGDGVPIFVRMFLQNSVDGSCAFEVSLRWYRQICGNGMSVLTKEDRFREVHHLDLFSIVEFRDFLTWRVPAVLEQASAFKEWNATKVGDGPLHDWIAVDVKAEWGPYAAARVFSICRKGYDGKVGGSPTKNRNLQPYDLFVSQDIKVPGAVVPATSLYNIYQALTWVADHRNTVEDREAWGITALGLAKRLAVKIGFRSPLL